MNALRLVTLAAAAPSAQALDSGRALGTAAQAAGTAAHYVVPVAEGAIGSKVGQKVGAVQNTVKAGSDAVAGVNELVS